MLFTCCQRLLLLLMGVLTTVNASLNLADQPDGSNDGNEDDRTFLEELPAPQLVSDFMKGGVDVRFQKKEEDYHGEGSEKQATIERETLERLAKLDKHSDAHSRHKRVIMTHPDYLWTDGIIPYEFSPEVSGEDVKTIHWAMDLIEQGTCIRFYERHSSQYSVPHDSYLRFVIDDGCWSYVGRRYPEAQEISACETKTRVLHEILHALGAFHEQSHASRDDYIHIKYGNIKPGKGINFERLNGWYMSSGVYSAESVMHYNPHAMSSNGFRTIVPLVDYISFSGISYWNAFRQVNEVYKCTDGCKLSCQNGGFPAYHGNRCRCFCVQGFDPQTQCRTFSTSVSGTFVNLTRSQKTADVTLKRSPAFSLGRQYMWMMRGPPKSKLVLDFLKVRISGTRDACTSTLVIKPDNPGGVGMKLCGEGLERTIISENNTILLTLKSSDVTDRLHAKVKLLLEDDWCYSLADRGATYDGEMNRAADNSECLKWTEAVHCDYNPFKMSSLPADYSGNECRNPGGVLARPWCYTDINAAGCDIKYCDACGYGRVYDSYDDCSALLLDNPNYCNTTDGLYGCRKTCHIPPVTVTSAASCDPPKAVAGSSIVGNFAASYEIGSDVTYQCNTNAALRKKRYCLSTGKWSVLNAVCGGEIADSSSDCAVQGQDFCHSPQGPVKCAGTCFLMAASSTVTTCDVPSVSPTTDHSMLTTSGAFLSVGDTAVYACLPGHRKLSGDEQRTCNKDGTLTGQPLKCHVVVCDVPEPPATDSARRISPPSVPLGSPAVYECLGGSLLSGSVRRTCQMDGSLSGNTPRCGDRRICVDIRSDCSAVLDAVPDMCTIYNIFSSDCTATCGNCERKDVQCSVPIPKPQDRVIPLSSSSDLYPGDVVRYKCSPLKHLLSGHLVRACRLDGTLTGQQPICTDDFRITSWINSMVMGPLKRVSPKVPFAILGASKYTTVQRYGFVRCWKAFCVRTGQLRFVVVKRRGTFPNYSYTVTGQNEVSCHDDRVMTWCPPPRERLKVRPGDLLGVVDLNGGNIQYTFCEESLSGDNFAEYTNNDSASNIKTGHMFWSDRHYQRCMYYGLNALIGPAGA